MTGKLKDRSYSEPMPAASVRVYLQPNMAPLPYWHLEIRKFMRRKDKRQKQNKDSQIDQTSNRLSRQEFKPRKT